VSALSTARNQQLKRGKKNYKVKKDMLRSISKFQGIHVVRPEEEKEGYSGIDLQKRNVLSME